MYKHILTDGSTRLLDIVPYHTMYLLNMSSSMLHFNCSSHQTTSPIIVSAPPTAVTPMIFSQLECWSVARYYQRKCTEEIQSGEQVTC